MTRYVCHCVNLSVYEIEIRAGVPPKVLSEQNGEPPPRFLSEREESASFQTYDTDVGKWPFSADSSIPYGGMN